MRERVLTAALRFFGHLASLDQQQRLAGWLFRRRCDQVDRDRGKFSWCVKARALLQETGLEQSWHSRSVPEKWRDIVHEKVQQLCGNEAARELQAKSSLRVFCQMRPVTTEGWLDRAFVHRGARVRQLLRCGQAPIMERVGASAKLPREQRTCRICNSGQVEDAKHFVCDCPHYAAERKRCMDEMKQLVAKEDAPRLERAIDSCDLALFLDDHLLRGVSPEVAQAVDRITCGIRKRAWRARAQAWKDHHLPGNEWRLK